ncbi:serine/threonine-protein kinase Nek2 isoform X1 [Patella vulgata]|uniref:serine/threonine-protein kinase Nek2 isoform X1 n=2 Tax=Patella vulgata TaxID=6465 RepID=UPI002180013A|nr:serine/threonine-protein kinase Nek2 isoform X1 [Patella vulgata]
MSVNCDPASGKHSSALEKNMEEEIEKISLSKAIKIASSVSRSNTDRLGINVKIQSDLAGPEPSSKCEIMEKGGSANLASYVFQTPRMPTTVGLDDFEVLSTIGTGSYGTCKKIRRKKDGKVLVWKEMDYGSMTESEKKLLVSEVNLLRELKHCHIVRYYDRIIDRSNTTIYIIMEYCGGGDLATLISRCRRDGIYVDEEFVWKIVIQLTLALKECHRRKNGKAVLHRDLKPANVFLDSDQNVKLGDFGLARVLHHETSFAKTYVGTPYYMSPELVNNMSYNEKSDIWSLGCMMYELCALHPPFTAANQTDLNRKIRLGDFSRIPMKYSSDLDMIIRKMIQVEVSKRPGIDAILNEPLVISHQTHSDRRLTGSSESPSRFSLESGDGNKRLEEELRNKLKLLELKEREMESRERSVALREKLADDKLRRALELYQQCKKQDSPSNDENRYNKSPSPVTELLQQSPSCLSKGKKDIDSPKKHVSFDMYGKENLRKKSKYTDYGTRDYDKYTDIYSREFTKRQEVNDRLFQAKTRAYDIGTIGVNNKYKSRNLLYFR